MKCINKLTILLALFALSCTTVCAQLKFVSDNKNDLRILADSIVLNAKRNYQFSTEQLKDKESFYILRYRDVDNPTNMIPVGIKIYMEGKNVDLEIERKPIYYFSIVQGRFLDLFPFWKKYIDVNADENIISKKGNARTKKDNRTFFFKKEYNELWTIEMNKF